MRFERSCFPVLRMRDGGSGVVGNISTSCCKISGVKDTLRHSGCRGNNSFPSFLLGLALGTCQGAFNGRGFSVILCMPPARSNSLIGGFTRGFSEIVGIPLDRSLMGYERARRRGMFRGKCSGESGITGTFGCSGPGRVVNGGVVLVSGVFSDNTAVGRVKEVLARGKTGVVTPVAVTGAMKNRLM